MKKAVILLSGGLDSCTCFAIAKAQGFACYGLSFDYGQRSRIEITAAKRIFQSLGGVEHTLFQLDLAQFGGSALTDKNIAIPTAATTEIPLTYVPARNTIFLSIALAWAEVIAASDIFIGANVIDYSNYPDCRPEYLQAYQQMANLATQTGVEGQGFRFQAPLLQLSKAEIIAQGCRLGVDYSLTCSCYDADQQGRACGICDSCRLRATGFQQAGVSDPTIYVSL